ncbi:MAG TPA: FtsX-like permease family protein [Acidimicrobiia bacterium]
MTEQPRRGSLTLGGRVLWSQITSAPAAALTIFVATLLTALFVSGVPRILERVSEDDLREGLAAAEPEQRNISAVSTQRIHGNVQGDPFAHVGDRGEALLTEGFPESLRSIVADRQYVMDTPQFRVTSFPDDTERPFPTNFQFRHQQGIGDHLDLTSGSLPEENQPIEMLFGGECPDDRLAVDDFEESPEVSCFVAFVPVFQAAVTSATAEEMMLHVGDRVFLRPDGSDPLWFIGTNPEDHTFVLEISGIIELSDLSEEYWYADPRLHRPRIVENPDFRSILAFGLMRPDQYDRMLTSMPTRGFRYMWRYFIDPERIEATRAEELRADVARILPPNEEQVFTSLDDLITEFLDQRALTVGLMSTAVTGLLVTAVGLILVLAALIADRQAGATVLIRDRGASRGQLALTGAYTGLLLVASATLLGYLVVTAAMPETDALLAGRGSAVLVLGGTIAVVVAGAPYAFRRLGALQRPDTPADASSGRRIVVEIFVLIAAVASVALLRRRGLADPSEKAAVDFDALLAATPAIIGFGAGLVVLRLMVPLMRSLSWIGGRRRDAVAFLGFRRLISLPAAGRAPTVVVLLAVAVAVFSSVVQVAISEGQERHSWQVAGADFRVEGRAGGVRLPAHLDLAGLADGMSWAEGAEFPDTAVIGLARPPRVSVLAIDADAYRQVLAGSDTEVPALTSLVDGAARSTGPAPVLISSRWGEEGVPDTGTQFALEMGSLDPRVVVAGVVDSFPALSLDEPFVVIGLEDLRRAWGELPVPATVVYLRGPEAETERLDANVDETVGLTLLRSRYEVLAGVAGDPFAQWVDRGLVIIFYLALAFGIVASLSLLTVTASRRRRDLGYLRTLGLTSRQAMMITILEQVPPLVVATLVGAATGGVMARLLAPALDIESFTGGLLAARVVVEPLAILGLTGAIVVLLGVAAISFVAATRDEEYGTLLEVGDQ